MKSFKLHSLFATAALLALGASAQAAVNAVDVPRITNGGTGFIGLTESAGTPRAPMDKDWRHAATSSVPQQAGEATTMVDGRPNAIAAGAGGSAMQQGVAMGAAAATLSSSASPRNDPLHGRGTPD